MNSAKILKAMTISVFFAAAQASAGVVNYTLINAIGPANSPGCNSKNVQSSSAGNDLAITMSNMNINMPAGVLPKVKLQNGTCLVYVRVTVPAGETISDLQTTLLGGIEKDLGVTGYLSLEASLVEKLPQVINSPAATKFIGPLVYKNRNLSAKEAISEPLFDLTAASPVSAVSKKKICTLTATKSAEIGLVLKVMVVAARQNVNQNALLNIDTIDHHMNLAMNAEACH
jgi:hypothetical protein